MTSISIRLRCTAVSTAATVSLAGAALVLLTGGGRAGDATDAAAAVTQVCTVALLGGLAWGWLAIQAGVVQAWRHAGRAPRAPVPPAGGVRRWTLAACGIAVTGLTLVAPGAHAAAPPDSATAPAPAPTVLAVTAHPTTVVVHAGDCLWSLAAAEVQPGAGPATVTARWRAIYHANRDVIGRDPDLIRPGQRLRMPR